MQLDDIINAYASASGFSDSPHAFFNNQDFGGGVVGSGTRPP